MSIPHGGSPAAKAAKPREDRGRPDQHGSGQSSKGHPCRSPEMASSAKQGECCTLGDQRDKPRWQATQSRGQHTPHHTHTHRHGRRRDHAWGALGPQRDVLVCLGSKQQSLASMLNLDPNHNLNHQCSILILICNGSGCLALSFKGSRAQLLTLAAAPLPPRFCTHFSMQLFGPQFLPNGAPK